MMSFSRTSSRLLLPSLGTLVTSAAAYLILDGDHDEAQMVNHEERGPGLLRHAPPRPSSSIISMLGGCSLPTLCEVERAHVVPGDSFHHVNLPLGIDDRASQVLGRFLKYARGDLSEVAKFRKEKNRVPIYMVPEVSRVSDQGA